MHTNHSWRLLGLFVLFYVNIHSLSAQVSLPSVSPTALSYGKYADIPVNKFNGTSNITVPISTVTDGPLSLPIYLQYHTAGLRPQSNASYVGLGWNLNMGGIISRVVRGKPDDDKQYGYYYKGGELRYPTTRGNDRYWNYDSEPDIYTYALPSGYGKFYFTSNGDVQTIPKSDTKIKPVLNRDGFFTGFLITDTNGIQYHFGTYWNYSGQQKFAFDDVTDVEVKNYNDEKDELVNDRSAWHLLAITSADKNHWIEFDYKSDRHKIRIPPVSPFDFKFRKDSRGSVKSPSIGRPSENYAMRTVIPTRIRTSRNRNAVLFRLEDRKDLWGQSNTEESIDSKRVGGISMYDDGACVQYTLKYSYFKDDKVTVPNPDVFTKLKLDAIQKASCYGIHRTIVREPEWKFSYYTPRSISSGQAFVPSTTNTDIDHWGFYNYDGTNENDSRGAGALTPKTEARIGGRSTFFGHANREPNEDAMKIGILTKVTYPTGGSLSLDYEANRVQKFTGSTNRFRLDVDSSPGSSATGSKSYLYRSDMNKATWRLDVTPFFNPDSGSDPIFDPGDGGSYPDDEPYSNSIGTGIIRVYASNGRLVSTISHTASVEDSDEGHTGLLPKIGYGSYQNGELQENQTYTIVVEAENATVTLTIDEDNKPGSEIVGGLRIKKTTVYNGVDHDLDLVTNYKYATAKYTDVPSGHLFYRPTYVRIINSRTAVFSSYSQAPLTSFGGYHVGYERVIVDHNGNGYTEHLFNLEVEEEDDRRTFPYTPNKYKAENGTLKSQSAFDENNIKVSTTANTRYTGDYYENSSGLIFAVTDIPVHRSGNNFDWKPLHQAYRLRTGIYRPQTITNTVEGISSTVSFKYTRGTLPPTETVTVDNLGNEYKVKRQYTKNYPITAVRDRLLHYNLVNAIYQERHYTNDEPTGGTENEYRFYKSTGKTPKPYYDRRVPYPRLYKTKRLAIAYDGANRSDSGMWTDVTTIDEYTTNGLVEKYRDGSWQQTIIRYDGKRPISKESGKHKQYFSYVGNSSLLKRTTAVDGTTTSYTYDELARLKTVSDDCNDIVTTYDYEFNYDNRNIAYTQTTTRFPNESDAGVSELISRKYTDGLGRVLGNVALNMGPSANEDLVSTVVYDKYGRVTKKYTPFTVSNNDGAWPSVPASQPYTATTFESSPLSRPLTSTPPSWSTTRYEYGVNRSSDKVLIKGTNNTYAPGTLRRSTIIDGNGNRTTVFENSSGDKILSRATNASDHVSARVDTYYEYDNTHRLIAVLPSGATGSNHKLAYTYKYDRYGNLKEDYVPGRGKTFYRYDERQLLVAHRSASLLQRNLWYAYEYDNYGRVLNEGFKTGNITENPGSVVVDDRLVTTRYGANLYDRDKVVSVWKRILDPQSTSWRPTDANWLQTTSIYSSCGRLEQQLGNNHYDSEKNHEITTYAYDEHNRLQGSTYNHDVNGDITSITSSQSFDHAGRPLETFFQVGTGRNVKVNQFVYDERGNVVTKYQGGTDLVGTKAWLQKIDYSYLANGMLEEINRGRLTGEQVGLPKHGRYPQTPAPGAPSTSSLDAKDLFSLQLYRNTSPKVSGTRPSARYNGDITFVASQVRGRRQQMFGVKYDHLNRMTDARFFERTTRWAIALPKNYYRETVGYDKRGNIESLDRDAIYKGNNGTYYVNGFDRLTYNYTPDGGSRSNQLVSITDGGHPTRGAIQTRGKYTYDVNGNMTYDPSKQITITYNYLNLPVTVAWLRRGRQRMEFTYDATGTLLTKQSFDRYNNRVNKRDYVGGIEYENDNLVSVAHPEGRVKLTGSTQRFEYALTDHLGNTRLLYTDFNGDGVASVPDEIIQENHYLPFGMKMNGPWMKNSSGDDMAYGYNGIEHVNEFNLGVDMATYRTLDPVIGRWWQVDPKAEATMSLTPYGSMNNSPMTFADPDGDIAFIAAVGIGAALGVIGNGVGNSMNGQNFFQGAGQAAIFGAIGGAVSFGIGSAATSLASQGASKVGVAAFQAGAHAYSGGLLSAAQGGSFLHGAASGAFSSAVGSGIGALGGGGGWQIAGGTLSGGVGSSIAGGSFLQGAIQGAITSGLNHAAHRIGSRVPFTNEALREVAREYWGAQPDHVTSLEIATPGNTPEGLTYKGGNMHKANGNIVGGKAIPIGNGGSSKIIMSRLVFGSKQWLATKVGHEYFHANLINVGIMNGKRHHATIIPWQRTVGATIGFNRNASGFPFPGHHQMLDIIFAPTLAK